MSWLSDLIGKAPKRAGRIATKPPVPQEDRHGLAMVLILRNAAAHIDDWLAFHALAGARHIIVYDNASSDDTVARVRAFRGCETTVIPWVMNSAESRTGMILPRQVLAYTHAIGSFGGAFERMAFTDLDEYIVPREAQTILEAIEAAGLMAFPNISLNWVMFGHDGHDAPPSDAMPFAYRHRAREAKGPLLNYKCIVDPCDVTMVSTHRFETRSLGDKSANTRGELTPNRDRNAKFASSETLQLNHYYLLSRQEMEMKMSGPAVSGTDPAQRRAAIAEKATLIESAPVKDLAAIEFLARHGIYSSADLRARFSTGGAV